ncbi:unnamed protein product [Urochloa humidicola]
MVTGSSSPPAPIAAAAVAAAAAAAAAHRKAIREDERRKKSQSKQGEKLLSTAATATKRKTCRVKQPKAPTAKRLKSPMVSMSPLGPARSTGIRMMLSSSQESPISPFMSKRKNLHRGSTHRNKRKLTSRIWQDFEPIYDNGMLTKAQCIHCNQLFKADRGSGTSACGRHLKTCKGKTKLNQMVSQLSSGVSLDDVCLKDWKFSQEVARQELVKLIVMHELPFTLVEYPKFGSFVSALNPWFKHVSRTTIRSDYISYYEEGKVDLRKIISNLKSRVSLTADMWTSNQTLGYLCVTAHYIDDEWILHKQIIKFTLVESPHDGRTMFNAFLKTLQDWNIESKVFAITLDNAQVNDNFVATLQENLVDKGQLLRKGKLFHCHCAAHVFNLIVQEGFKAVSTATKNIRDSVKYVKSSQARKQRFEEMAEQVGLPNEKRPPLDVVTRWNSTYLMLETALKYRRAYAALRQNDPQYTHEPSTRDWKVAKKLYTMLEPFYEATKLVSGSKYPTSSLYFHMLWEVKKELDNQSSNTDSVIASMVHGMREKMNKYWDLSYLQICIPVILDPRFKMRFLEFRLGKWFEDEAIRYISKVEKTFRKLFAEYSSEINVPILEKAHTVSNNELHIDDNGPWADWGQHQSAQKSRRTNELDKYLEEETMPVESDLDILQYWKMHLGSYPILARMARDILAVPASTVASESAFSTGERIVSDYRSRLKSETIEALICLQDWLRSEDTTLDNIAGNVAGNELDCI